MEEHIVLRFGSIASIYYDISGTPMPKQLDLLDAWFPELIVQEEKSDGETKKPAEYKDTDYLIHAVKCHGKLYSGDSRRIPQITGRLTGSATGNQEKERRTAELIQRHIAERFITDMTLTPRLQANTKKRIDAMNDEQVNELYQFLLDLVWQLAAERRETDRWDRDNEPFHMYDETFDGVIYNTAYQLNLETYEGLCNAYLWLLTGGLLRNETGRILRMYDSKFLAVNRQPGEMGELEDKLNALFNPEQYYYTFDGDEEDLKNRFPDVHWTCDNCGDYLNEQEGFDDHLPEWKCTKCGYVNKIDISEIYQNDEDYRNHIRSSDPEKFAAAVEARRKELKEK